MDISVVLSTYNRCDLLRRSLECLMAQQAPCVEYEIIVVDNNSDDDTKEVVEAFRARDSRIRYLFEPRQGLSYGRNAGIRVARAEAIAFTDDDVEVASDWMYQIHRALSQYPDADFIGGRVLPVLNAPLPAWAHTRMAPFALQDFGERPIAASSANLRYLMGGCLATRRRAFATAGLFSTETQRVKDSIGSSEDYDWGLQLWKNGGRGMYVPNIICHCEVPRDRLAKSYHRRWHLGRGKFAAVGQSPEWESPRRLLSVPLFVYRQAFQTALQIVGCLVRAAGDAFEHECNFLFYLGFIKQRWKMYVLGKDSHNAARNSSGVYRERYSPSRAGL